ncbi:cytoskeletal protein RodZ [Salinisphaera sp. PC39]|uniref:RodZ domain-containing protein n=1 Tax=Salinisphaera sp. PC39 TaxID=1304156 RepID=UPI0033427972
MSDDTHDQRDGEGDAGDAPDPRLSPGERLRRAREDKGLSLDELAAQTLLSRSTLVALEENDFERLSQPVFVRGYYRKCAKVLDLPEDELMTAYAEYTGVPGPRPASPGQVDVIPQDVTPRSWRALSLLLTVAFVVAALAVVWWLVPRLTGGLGDDGTTPAVDRGAFERSALQPPAGGEASGQETQAAGANAPDTTGASSETPPARTSEPAAPETETTTAAGSARLELRFEARSWVEVRDATGARLLDGILPAGSERMLEGEPPYQVSLGNAPAVELRLGGRPVDFSDRIRDNNTVRLTLPAEGAE